MAAWGLYHCKNAWNKIKDKYSTFRKQLIILKQKDCFAGKSHPSCFRRRSTDKRLPAFLAATLAGALLPWAAGAVPLLISAGPTEEAVPEGDAYRVADPIRGWQSVDQEVFWKSFDGMGRRAVTVDKGLKGEVGETLAAFSQEDSTGELDIAQQEQNASGWLDGLNL